MKYEVDFRAYVADDGNYGVDTVLTFDFAEFEQKFPKVWDRLEEIYETQRTEFLIAVMDGDEETVQAICEDSEINPADIL